tara:strand:- start:26638 stop:26880 length:243 start_codon:yes stop_codon:yes gene_type:complete
MDFDPKAERNKKQMTIHGPTQRYYYIKMKQAERIFKEIVKINPANPDRNKLMEVWDEAQNYLTPKSLGLKYYKVDKGNEN